MPSLLFREVPILHSFSPLLTEPNKIENSFFHILSLPHLNTYTHIYCEGFNLFSVMLQLLHIQLWANGNSYICSFSNPLPILHSLVA